MKTELYIDTETTGLDPAIHGLIQVAVIAMVDDKEVGRLNIKMNPNTYVDGVVLNEYALKVNNTTEEDLKTFQHQNDACLEFLLFLQKLPVADELKWTPVGYNVGFDVGFIKAWFEENSLHYGHYFSYASIDVLSVVRYLKSLGVIRDIKNAKLTTLCDWAGIELDAHDAMRDIEATKDLLGFIAHVCVRKPEHIALKMAEVKMVRKS